MKFKKPKVYLIGETVINQQQIVSYLRDTGQQEFLADIDQARSEGLSYMEILCSFYAKLCYAALTVEKNENISKVRSIADNIRGTIKSGHGSVFEHASFNFVVTDCSRVFCYGPNTMVMTVDGFKNIKEITKNDLLLTRNEKTGLSKWECPESIHEFNYDGIMMGWTNSQMSTPSMTEDHIILAADYDLRKNRGLTCEEIFEKSARKVPIGETYDKRFVIGKGIKFEDNDDVELIKIGEYEYDLIDLYSYLGWVATDGNFSRDRKNQITITQTKYKDEISKLMNRLFKSRWRSHGPYGDSESELFIINDKDLANFSRDSLGDNKANRKLGKNIITSPKRLLKVFLDACIRGDGSIHKENGHKVLYCPSKVAAEQFQFIGAVLGEPCNMRIDNRIGENHELNGNEVFNNNVMYVLDFSSRGTASLIQHKHKWYGQYSGKVYCPKTKNGIIFIKDSGHPFWSGNTHEIVRHRVGTAFSQTSGRYVRGEEINFVHDPILDDFDDVIKNTLEDIETRYKYICEKVLYGVRDFGEKKKITSALRRVLPNGQTNEIGFSCNLRALRHIITMRTSRHAEWEIRYVFNQVAELIKDKCPVFFEDILVEEFDELNEITFKNGVI
jgi:thymidylate synthase ThyX